MKIKNGLCVALSLLAGASVSVYAADTASEGVADEASATETSSNSARVEQVIVWATLPAQFRTPDSADAAEANTCAESYTLECSSIGRWSHF